MHYERTFTIGITDVLAFYRQLTLAHGVKGIVGFGVVGAMIAMLYRTQWARASTLNGVIYCGGIGILVALLVALALVLRTNRNIKKKLTPASYEPYEEKVEIDGFGVHVTAKGKTGTRSFDKLVRVWENKTAFYIFVTKGDAWILPKNQMEHVEEESAEIRRIFKTVMLAKQLKLKNK